MSSGGYLPPAPFWPTHGRQTRGAGTLLNKEGARGKRPGSDSRIPGGRPHGSAADQAQEKPVFDEQPDRAPLGIEEWPDEIRKLEAEMVFLTFRLPHLLHSTALPCSLALVITSKLALQSRHLYSYMGMMSPWVFSGIVRGAAFNLFLNYPFRRFL